MGAMIGGLGGFMLAYQQSSGDIQRKFGSLCLCDAESTKHIVAETCAVPACSGTAGRLMGFFPNDKEVELGLAKK